MTKRKNKEMKNNLIFKLNKLYSLASNAKTAPSLALNVCLYIVEYSLSEKRQKEVVCHVNKGVKKISILSTSSHA